MFLNPSEKKYITLKAMYYGYVFSITTIGGFFCNKVPTVLLDTNKECLHIFYM